MLLVVRYQTWPDVRGTDYGDRRPTVYHHHSLDPPPKDGSPESGTSNSNGNSNSNSKPTPGEDSDSDGFGLYDWHQEAFNEAEKWNPLVYVGRDALTAENPPSFSDLNPVIPVD